MPESCLTNEQLRRLLDSGVSADEQVKLRQHLDRCGDCRKRLETLAGGTAWLPPAHGLSQGKPSANSPELVQAMKQLRSETTEVHQEKALPSDITAPGFLSPPGKPGIIGRLGDYEILVEISRGGMGIVFKAHDPSLDRVVAIKVLAPELASRTNARSRFLREARAAAAVTHEHVITIHAVEETPAVPYLVMQFIGGRTLEERIGDKPLTLVEILRIGFQIASGLEAAHQHGLIHRDIKPGNILLENSVERVKITDFGLARAAEDTNLTQTGYVAGTPEYMAPEQVRGEAIDQRADLFSLGCVLYKMCTGVSPFRAPTLMGVLHKVCNEAHESARALNPQLSERLSQLIDRLLAKEPSQRPQTAHEIARKLSRYLARLQENEPDSGTGSEPQTRPKRLPAAWSWARRGKSWVVALISVALIGIAIRAVWFKPIRNAQSVAPNHASASTAPSPFVVAGSDGSRERGTLQEAVQAAPPGAVIECRFDGDQELDPISLGNKPLILRAAPGFHPAFTPRRHTEPLLLTRAALVIEGLTFKGGPAVTPPLEDRKGAAPSPAIIEVLGAPILLANCHFGIPPADPQADPAGCCVRLLNAAYGHFENCEFYTGPGGCAIATDRHSAAQNNAPPDQIIVRNCVQRGWMLVSLSRVDRGDTTLHLTRNIVSGTGLLNVNLRPATPPWAVFATQNVFDVAYLLQTLSPADQRSPQKLVQWHDRQNLFSFRPARADAQTLPGAKTFNEDVLAGGTNGSVVLPVNIFRRMNNLPMDGEKHDVRHFLLSPQEEAEVKRQTPGLSGMLGINPEIAGPGEGYDAWRKTSQYREWQKLVEQHTRAR